MSFDDLYARNLNCQTVNNVPINNFVPYYVNTAITPWAFGRSPGVNTCFAQESTADGVVTWVPGELPPTSNIPSTPTDNMIFGYVHVSLPQGQYLLTQTFKMTEGSGILTVRIAGSGTPVLQFDADLYVEGDPSTGQFFYEFSITGDGYNDIKITYNCGGHNPNSIGYNIQLTSPLNIDWIPAITSSSVIVVKNKINDLV